MRLICENGFYKFYPDYIGEIRLWQNKNGVKLYEAGDYFTFEALKDLPDYSLKGQFVYKVIPAIVNYTGRKEDVLCKNDLTYNIKLATITPKALVMINKVSYTSGAFMSSPSIPQAYALDQDGQQITGFSAFVDVKIGMYKIERFFYEDL